MATRGGIDQKGIHTFSCHPSSTLPLMSPQPGRAMPLYRYFISVSCSSCESVFTTPGISTAFVVLRIVRRVWSVRSYFGPSEKSENGKGRRRGGEIWLARLGIIGGDRGRNIDRKKNEGIRLQNFTLASSTPGPYGGLSRMIERAPTISLLDGYGVLNHEAKPIERGDDNSFLGG